MTLIEALKILTAILVVIGVIVQFFSIKSAPHGLLLESSPKPRPWLPWLGWALTSIAAIFYIVLDWLN
jgi:hypothetical protein